jgi:hypothetical protein
MTINVIPRDGTVNGKTLKEYIIEFWQAICSIPKEDNPAWQNDGSKDESFNNNVKADLYMLSFSRDPQTAQTRNIEVPNGKGLFIPVMSVEVSECETSLPLVETAKKDQESIDPSTLSLKLDDSSIDLSAYEFDPKEIDQFHVNFPSSKDAIFKVNNSLDTCNAVAAGRYIWTEALSPGEYTVYYSGALQCGSAKECIETNYSENITYKIRVTP